MSCLPAGLSWAELRGRSSGVLIGACAGACVWDVMASAAGGFMCRYAAPMLACGSLAMAVWVAGWRRPVLSLSGCRAGIWPQLA